MNRRAARAALVTAALAFPACSLWARHHPKDKPPDPTTTEVIAAKGQAVDARAHLEQARDSEREASEQMLQAAQTQVIATDIAAVNGYMLRIQEAKKAFQDSTVQRTAAEQKCLQAGLTYVQAENSYAKEYSGGHYDEAEFRFWNSYLQSYEQRPSARRDQPQKSAANAGGGAQTNALPQVQTSEEIPEAGKAGYGASQEPGAAFGHPLEGAQGDFRQSALKPGSGDPSAQALSKGILLSPPPLSRRERMTLQTLNSILAKLENGDHEGALREAEKAVLQNPEDPSALTRKAEILYRMGRYADAEKAAQEAVRLNPDQADAYRHLIKSQLKQGKYSEAVQSVTGALLRNPANAEAMYLRAFAYSKLGKKDAMLLDLKEAARLVPEKYGAQYEAAMAGKEPFGDDIDDSRQLQESIAGARGRRGPLTLFGMILLALALAAGIGVALRQGKRTKPKADEFTRTLAAAAEMSALAAESRKEKCQILAERYEMLRIIGKGGMGQVWEGRDKVLDRRVAIKRLPPEMAADAQARARAIQEAHTLGRLQHPNIVKIYEVLDLPSGLYLVFELVTGKTLQQIIAESKRLTPKQAWKVLHPVCEALEFAHGRGIVHRDMKPSNIMITAQGFVKVMDFGIARQVGTAAAAPKETPAETTVEGPPATPPPSASGEQPRLPGTAFPETPSEVAAAMGERASTATPEPEEAPPSKPEDEALLFGLPMARTRTIQGTPRYMAPESEEGLVSPESDVFSLGVCLYEMLTGIPPFRSNSAIEKMEKSYQRPVALLPGLPPIADEIVCKALEPRLDSRLRLREFKVLLERLAKDSLQKAGKPAA
ncbi:MAG: protein kinase [Elusimicrobia bacterium]|nr:protein kinase [Elusimicrobiota bacterium]